MIAVAEVIDRYVAVWNEPDATARRHAIERLWREDAVYTNALAQRRGHDAIAAGVTFSHDKWVGTGHAFRCGRIDEHHNVIRFVWHMYGPSDAEGPVSTGTNFIILDDDGRIAADHQFVDR